MKEVLAQNCPKCGTDFSEARRLLKEQTLAFCLKCKFPLVLVAGKYRLEKELGQGGYGVVYKARHIYLETDYLRVVKILKPDVFELPGMEQRFYREVQVTSVLSQKDEHIIRIYDDFGKLANIGPFYVMEFLEGIRLDSLLVQSTHLPGLSFVLHIFRQLCQSIQFAHEAGVVHRDLKPENLYLVERRGDKYFLKIIDFGIAKPLNQQELKMTQGVLGSPFYMAPEQCLNQHVDARTDIYAMGCILFELLTGFPPFHPKLGNTKASSLVELLGAHVAEPPPSPRMLRPERVSPALEKILLKALEKNPALRFQSASAFLAALEAAHNPLPSAEFAASGYAPQNLVVPLEATPVLQPTADFPALGTVPAKVELPSGPLLLEGTDSSASWDDLSRHSSDTVIRSFFQTIQHTMRDEEGIRYYRVIMVLALFLAGGATMGWWFFFFTHGGSARHAQVSVKRPTARMGTALRAKVRQKERQRVVPPRPAQPPEATPDAGAARAPLPRPIVRAKSRVKKRAVRRRSYRRRALRRRALRRPVPRPTPRLPRPHPVPRIVVIQARPAPRVTPPPIKGCPKASAGVRWVRLDVRPSHIAATIRVIRGVGQSYRHSFGFCLGLRSSLHIRIDANEFRPCTIRLSHKHARLSIRMKKDRLDAIETNQGYCLR